MLQIRLRPFYSDLPKKVWVPPPYPLVATVLKLTYMYSPVYILEAFDGILCIQIVLKLAFYSYYLSRVTTCRSASFLINPFNEKKKV